MLAHTHSHFGPGPTHGAPGTARRRNTTRDKENAGVHQFPTKTPMRAPLGGPLKPGTAGPSRALGAKTVERNVLATKENPVDDIGPKRLFQTTKTPAPQKFATTRPAPTKTPAPTAARHQALRTPAPARGMVPSPAPLPSAQRTRRRSRLSIQSGDVSYATPAHSQWDGDDGEADAELSLDSILEADVEVAPTAPAPRSDDGLDELPMPTAKDMPWIPDWHTTVPDPIASMRLIGQMRPTACYRDPDPVPPMVLEEGDLVVTLCDDDELEDEMFRKKNNPSKSLASATVPLGVKNAESRVTSRGISGVSGVSGVRGVSGVGSIGLSTNVNKTAPSKLKPGMRAIRPLADTNGRVGVATRPASTLSSAPRTIRGTAPTRPATAATSRPVRPAGTAPVGSGLKPSARPGTSARPLASTTARVLSTARPLSTASTRPTTSTTRPAGSSAARPVTSASRPGTSTSTATSKRPLTTRPAAPPPAGVVRAGVTTSAPRTTSAPQRALAPRAHRAPAVSVETVASHDEMEPPVIPTTQAMDFALDLDLDVLGLTEPVPDVPDVSVEELVELEELEDLMEDLELEDLRIELESEVGLAEGELQA